MIFTCTLNPSLDYYMEFEGPLKAGSRMNRSNLEYYEAGGKGINVSIVLNNLGIPSRALGFIGGFTKDFYISLLAKYDHIILLPVYRKNTYDFTDVDLVLTTVQKRITDDPGTTTLYISQFFDETDQEEISHYIMTKTLKPLYSRDVSLTALLRSTWWHQQENFSDPKDLLHRVTQEFIDRDIEDEAYQKDILEREQITSFSIFPGVVFLYSFVPAKRSQISVTTLDHRITWNGNKIRIVVAAAFTQEDMPAILRLTNFLYEDAYNVDVVKNMKTKEEILKYVQGSPQFFLNHS